MRTIAAGKRKRGSRQSFYLLHSWFGILAGLLLFIICWSGSFATLSHELDWLVTPAMRVTPSGAAADITAIHAVVADTVPNVQIVGVRKPLYDRFAADVFAETEDGQTHHFYVDPRTLKVTGSTPYFNLQRFFRDFHMNFYGLLGWGKYAVCIFAIPLIASLVTALVFYKRWWKRFFGVRLGKGSKAFWSSLHKTAGLWSMWFVIAIGVTGVWYLVEATRADAFDGKFSYVDAFPNAIKPLPELEIGNARRLGFGELVARARSAAPELDIRGVSLDRGGYFYVEGQTADVLVRDRANKMYLDPRDGRIAYYQTAGDLAAYWRWSDMADPIHFGSFGGLATKLIWFVFGVFLSGISLTGGWLHLKRLRRDNSGQTRWKGTIGAAVAGMLILLFCMAAATIRAIKAGPEIPLGVVAVASVWGASTIAICAVWSLALARPATRQVFDSIAGKRAT